MDFNSIYSTAILISGPDNSDHKSLESMIKKKIPNVFSIGDGKQDLLDANSQGLYVNEIAKLGQYSCFQDLTTRPLIIINAHGVMKEDEHTLWFGNKCYMPTKYIFENISTMFPNHPVDLLVISCHGGGALQDIGALPRGSEVLFLSNFDESTNGVEVKSLLKELTDSDKVFSINNYYEHFLMGGDVLLKPTFAVVGESSAMNPAQFFEAKLLGNEVPYYIVNLVQSKISQFCGLSWHCIDKLNKALDSIPTIKSFDAITPKPLSYYNAVLQYEKIKSSFKMKLGNDTCNENSSEVTSLVTAVNQLFADSSIPLQTSNSIYCHSIELKRDEEDDEYEDMVEYLKTQSDFAILRTYLEEDNSHFELNSNFPKPEQSEFGSYMLVSSFIEEYCGHNLCPELM